jgi:mycothiol synthase
VTGARSPAAPAGYAQRAATWDDLRGVAELFREADLADWGAVDMTEVAVRHDWEDPHLDMARDTWLVTEGDRPGPEAVPVAYASLLALDGHRQLQAWGVVRPSHRGRGLGSHLLDLVEARAAEHPPLAALEGGIFLRPGVVGPDRAAHRLVESRGYTVVRHYWRMDAMLTKGLEEPRAIPGIRIRPMVLGVDDRGVHAAHQESFADHWGFVRRGFDEWAKHRLHESAFDPDLWYVAEDGREIVGSLQGVDDDGSAWVGMLGVRPAWRKRGIGEALLRYAFIEFRRRGYERVGLSVDSANATGATALYERVGMRATFQYDIYEKRLR